MKSTAKHCIDKKAGSNPCKPQPLTPELLRSSSGLQHLTEEQTAEIIESLYTLARILLTATLPEELKSIDNQFIVNCRDVDQKPEKIIPLHSLPEQNDIAA